MNNDITHFFSIYQNAINKNIFNRNSFIKVKYESYCLYINFHPMRSACNYAHFISVCYHEIWFFSFENLISFDKISLLFQIVSCNTTPHHTTPQFVPAHHIPSHIMEVRIYLIIKRVCSIHSFGRLTKSIHIKTNLH